MSIENIFDRIRSRYGMFRFTMRQVREDDWWMRKSLAGIFTEAYWKVKAQKRIHIRKKAEKIKACLESLSQKEKGKCPGYRYDVGLLVRSWQNFWLYQKDAGAVAAKMGFIWQVYFIFWTLAKMLKKIKRSRIITPSRIYSKKADFEEFAAGIC